MLYLLATYWPILMAAEDDSSGGLVFAGLALFLAGPIFFSIIYARYRNKDARHFHESETPAQVNNLMVYDTFVKHEKGRKQKRIPGANESRISGSLNQGGKRRLRLK